MSPAQRTLAIALLAIGGLATFVALRMEIVSDVTHFLPDANDRSLARLSKEIAQSELTRTMVLAIGGPSADVARAAGLDLEAALREEPRVSPQLAFLEGGPPQDLERAMWELYQPRRLGFVADDGAAAEALTTDAGLAETARDLKRRLASPLSPLVSRVAPSDPFLALTRLFERLEGGRADGLAVVDGRFMTDDERHAFLFLGTRAAAFDGGAQRPLLEGLEDAFAEVNARHDGALTLQSSGVNRFAVRAETMIKGDIIRVSSLSVLGLLLLCALLFRSLRLVVLTAAPVSAGVLAGCAVNLALFGRVHSVTLAFGASLIGVCIDYAVHFYSHHVLAPDPGGPKRTLAHIWTGLLLGATTTVAGFTGLAWSSFPGLRELAVFAGAGIGTALLATRWLVPPLMPAVREPRPFQRRLAIRAGRLLDGMRARRRMLWALPAAAIGVIALGAPAVEWNDDIAALNKLDPALLAEDEAVRAKITRYEQGRMVVALGESEEEALQINDRVERALADAAAAGELKGYRTLAPMLPSAARQRAVQGALRSADVWPRLERALVREGFRPEGFAPFREALEAPPAEPVTFAELASSPLAPFVRPFKVDLGERTAFLGFLHGVAAPDAVAARLAGIDGAVFVDHGALMSQIYRTYRSRTVDLLLVGLAVVLALVALRYRSASRTLAAFAPAVLAAGVTVAVLALLGLPLNLLALTALLMVVSMGVDYGVFLVEAATSHPAGLPATLIGIIVACASTVLGFGLLALSDHPALQTIGVTSAVGIVASLLLAPTALVLTRSEAAA